MNNNYQKLQCYLVILLISFFGLSIHAQDIHYSQFNNTPFNINPSLVGAFNGDMRLGANYRSQWSGVPVDYEQVSGFADFRLVDKKKEDMPFRPWAVGMLFNYDHAGYSDMHWIQLGLVGSYTHSINQKSSLRIGGMVSGNQRAFDEGLLRFGDQYKGLSELTPTQESFSSRNKSFVSLDAGLSYRFVGEQPRNEIIVGGGFYHLNQPKTNFFDEDDHAQPVRTSLHAKANVFLTDALDFTINASQQFQGPHQETVLSAGLPIYLNTKKTKELIVTPGVGWRVDDAFYPYLQLGFNQWQVGFSYDINTSDFTRATDSRGGPEVSVLYTFKRPREKGYCPNCPKYL